MKGNLAPGWPVDGAPVCTAPGIQQLPVIAADRSGGMFVTWEDLRGATSDVYTQHVRADGVADPAWPVDGRATCAATGNQTRPQVLGDGLGGVRDE